MKNTLIVKKEFIHEEIINALQIPAGFASIEVIDNNHSWIINFNPNKENIEKYKTLIRGAIEKEGLLNQYTDTVIDGVVMSSLAVLYKKLLDLLMQEVINRYAFNYISGNNEVMNYVSTLNRIFNETPTSAPTS